MDSEDMLDLLRKNHAFPGPYMFKVIGRDQDGFVARVIEAVRLALQVNIDPPFRVQPSATGKHLSVTVEPHVFSENEVLLVYAQLQNLQGVMMVM